MRDRASALDEARRALARGLESIGALLDGLDAVAARTRPAPLEWAPVEIVCHLRDEETEDFGARLRVLLGGGKEFTPIDPERWVEERRYIDADPTLALGDLRRRRAGTLELLASLTPDTLLASAPHRRLGSLSGLDIVVAWVAHDRLHLCQLAATLARLWADRWAPLKADYAGPIPYPPPPAGPPPPGAPGGRVSGGE
jgi:hypothetical protein